MNKLLLCGIAAVCLYGQSEVALSELPPSRGATSRYYYDASDRIEYICVTQGTGVSQSIAVTQIVDAANTATVTTAANHGLAVNNSVTVGGVTGDTDLNKTYRILTVPSPTTFTVTSASVTDNTYNNAGIVILTAAPRGTEAVWSVKKFVYSATGKVTDEQWAVATGNVASSTARQHVCDNRATLSYQ